MGLPSGNLFQFANWKMAIEILDLHSYKMVIFHTHVSFPEGFNKFAAFQSIGRSLMIGQQFTGVIYIWHHPTVKGERINTIRFLSFLFFWSIL